MVTTVPWGDGSGDNIYLSYSASEGNQTVQVTSDAHTGYEERTKDITFTAIAGQTTITQTLTVKQSGKNIVIIVHNYETAITYNDTAVGYEQ